jgi:hypothetical protein
VNLTFLGPLLRAADPGTEFPRQKVGPLLRSFLRRFAPFRIAVFDWLHLPALPAQFDVQFSQSPITPSQDLEVLRLASWLTQRLEASITAALSATPASCGWWPCGFFLCTIVIVVSPAVRRDTFNSEGFSRLTG